MTRTKIATIRVTADRDAIRHNWPIVVIMMWTLCMALVQVFTVNEFHLHFFGFYIWIGVLVVAFAKIRQMNKWKSRGGMMAHKVKFKSTPGNWKKEYAGLKRTTVRECDDIEDPRFKILDDFINSRRNILEIEIEHTETGESFFRTVTDVSIFKELYIISW